MFDTEGISVRIGKVFSKLCSSANIWTVSSLLPAISGFLMLLYNNLFLAFVFFFISGIMDGIDGAVARVTRNVTKIGAFLDRVIDRYIELLLYVGLLFYMKSFPYIGVWVSLLIFGALMPSFVRAYADHKGVIKDRNLQKKMGGFLERPERLILIYTGMFLGCFNNMYLFYIIIVSVILSNFTTFQRIYFSIRYRK